MKRIIRFWKIIVIDTIGVALMILALLTGWLPGPGGIPLFIIGLSLLAIHHDWAQRYIDLLRKYADRLGDFIFINKPWLQRTYDVTATIGLIMGAGLLFRHSAVWMVSLGIFLTFFSVTFLLGNRGRWANLKTKLKQKH